MAVVVTSSNTFLSSFQVTRQAQRRSLLIPELFADIKDGDGRSRWRKETKEETAERDEVKLNALASVANMYTILNGKVSKSERTGMPAELRLR